MTRLECIPTHESVSTEVELSGLRPQLDRTMEGLIHHLQMHDFGGYDPYDGLRSALFNWLPLRNCKWARLLMIQLNKRSPVNFRALFRVPEERNPKGIALCASAFLNLRREADGSRYVETARHFLSWLLKNHTRGFTGLSWGYNFDWQQRNFFAPKGSPNAICTIFAANAFLDSFDLLQDTAYLDPACACCDFLVHHLLTAKRGELHFRYLPGQDTEIHNVNLLAAALLARVSACTCENRLLDIAGQAMRFTVSRQRSDGSWPYGEEANLRWIDNYHTGFNLVALSKYRRYSGDETFDEATRKGYAFWDRNFSRADGAPKLYPNCEYPVDIHCVAQTILTHLEFRRSDTSAKVARTLRWAWENMWSPAGYFYYQQHRLYTIRTAYARWGQAWMLYALSSLCSAMS